MVFLAFNKLLLRKTPFFPKNRVFLPKKGVFRTLGLRLIHQDYYHPHDVPAYQTPSLGEDKETKVTVRPEDIVMPMSNMDLRFEESKRDYTDSPPDNPREAIAQTPEMFLPEVPTFFEFWGIYPFFIFTGVFFLSKELFMLFANGQSSVFILALVIPSVLILHQNLAAMFYTNKQLTVDQYWIGITSFRKNLEKAIDFCQQNLKTKERAIKFDAYLKALTRYKFAYFSNKRKQEKIREIIAKLNDIKKIEESIKKYSVEDVSAIDMSKVKKAFENDSAFKADWDNAILNLISNSDDANAKTDADAMPSVGAKIKSVIDCTRGNKTVNPALVSSIKIYRNLIQSTLASLKIKAKMKPVPTEVKVEDLGLADKENKNGGIIEGLSKQELVKEKIRLINAQIDQFAEGKVPESLLKLMESVKQSKL